MGTYSVTRTLLLFTVLFFSLAVYAQEGTDTLKVVSQGIHNQITIDSTKFNQLVQDSIPSGVVGQINQCGEANSIEINTGKPIDPAKKSKQNITIKQTGKNNSVKNKLALSF